MFIARELLTVCWLTAKSDGTRSSSGVLPEQNDAKLRKEKATVVQCKRAWSMRQTLLRMRE
jgi:hypothetical protein